MTSWANLTLQDGASPLMEQMTLFHDHTLMVLIMITSFVGYLLGSLAFNKLTNRFMLEHQNIEIIWTILPAVILIFIAFPSLRLLYLMDEVNIPEMTLKAIGHQWYWSYEYSDFANLEYDSYMVPTSDLHMEELRLIETDNHVVLPIYTQVRVLISASDVIHSWTVPALGVKADAIPGRLNQVSFMIDRPGLFYGQCSEICGANHSFMPITIEAISIDGFLDWIYSWS
uniref:Cytochrome c oxidase subunit 2 n=1 Tax=Calocaris macandreae TaxID=1267412 RepID=L0E8W5_CALMF|nr:cytochrome c oxidase subunit II [Calocaris macandreae]